MPNAAKLKRHAEILDTMADTLGIDLQEAAICGAFPMGDISDAVLRCADCPNPGHCVQWLENHPDGAQVTPEYCRNQEVLQGLRP